ncbi:uncharacterized protein YjbI with pentapeptide repeats [Paenibacillus sp. SORGH_AS306]|uniref:pentapeptide repeat-containing protein n=1 Tax=unclassified Paenibacillus TaxID=185978 RepID=UPI00277E8E41|nr:MULTISPECIES: pentapeptide repeat-containing protein [unclassified Paenibacillus]MDQ1235850.1 uncharacterized protein YjbI with pentapeptide repeats [Paenibacillus sp. SORGH_AS_0306]MDR6112900.1 uncharacterized protein YjbI with pentapeptide repeats [Paenibacillus sp. SORGH_AS_0338]
MNISIEAPKIPQHLETLHEPLYTLQSKDEFSHARIEHFTIDRQEAQRVSFDKTIFEHVDMIESHLAEIELTDVIFDQCDLSNIPFPRSFVHRTEFRNCKLIGTDFAQSRLQNVRFTDCVADYSVFRFSQFKRVLFENCSLLGADYCSSVFNSVFFEQCQLDTAMLSGTSLDTVDLSTCDFTSLQIEIEDLRGCIISPYQASSFVGLMGLVIKS